MKKQKKAVQLPPELQKIKDYMKTQKITYEQLSKKSIVPLSTLKNIFSGRTLTPRVSTINAIYNALNLSSPYTHIESIKNDCFQDLTYPEIIEILNLCNQLKLRKGEQGLSCIKNIIQNILE